MAIAQLQHLWRVSAEKADNGHLPRWRQWLEIALLYVFRRQGPNYYFAARFFRRNISFRDKWRHCDDKEWVHFIDAVNDPLYQKCSQHKLIEKAVLVFAGVPTPTFAGFIHANDGYTSDHLALKNNEQADAFFRGYVGRRLCFKQVEGFGGTSFRALMVTLENDQIMFEHTLTKQKQSLADVMAPLWKDKEGTLVERYLLQHPSLQAFNPDSVNTVRLWIGEVNGSFESIGAFLRIGRRGTQVDNTSMGGLMCPLDLNTGRIVEARNIKTGETFTHHPDTGAALVNSVLPFWDEVLPTAKRAMRAFPHMRFAGLDIAIGEHGPMIIELNVNPDRRGATHIDLPHKDMFDRMLNSCSPDSRTKKE